MMPPQEKPRARVQVSLDIAASPPVLWATFTDLEKWTRWSSTIKSACCISETEWTLGAQFQLAMELPFPARQWSGVATITEVQPATLVSWETEYPLEVATIRSFRFKPTVLGTELSICEVYHGSWVAGMIYRLSGFPGQMRKVFEKMLQSLKTYLEVGA
jgi:uncharacterized protein YndB with AHSA1/START domain